MTYWRSEDFHQAGNQVVDLFDAQHVVDGSYELTLGPEVYVTGGEEGRKRILTPEDPQVIIPPGQFALLLTEEQVSIPEDSIGFISVRSRFKLSGLVNVSGFHVDPGFQGRLIFSVYNAGGDPVVASRGDRLFLFWLSSLTGQTRDTYTGDRQGQVTIPNADVMKIGRHHYSPAGVNDRLTAVEGRVETAYRIAVGSFVSLVVGLALLLAGLAIQSFLDEGERGVYIRIPNPQASFVQPTPQTPTPTSPSNNVSPSPQTDGN